MTIEVSDLGSERRTAADDIFEQLRLDIVNLRLLPGEKLSEADVASRQDVSRQPVREAFIRLSNMNLLQVQPQKATLVRKISNREILNTRFIRTAIDVEIVRTACTSADSNDLSDIESNLAKQKKAVRENNDNLFHELDYDFHRLLCVAAKCDAAFKTIAENKSHVDRLCMLSLASPESRQVLLEDHSKIFDALKQKDTDEIVALTRQHLSRLDATLVDARKKHPKYFED